MLESNLSVQDMEQASVSLDKFIKSITEISIGYSGDNGNTNESRAEMSSLATRHILGVLQPRTGLDQRLQLSVIYDTLIASWIRPLSEEIPSRVRVTAEKMLRDIAAQLYLSSFGVRLKSKSVESKDLDYQQPSEDDIVFSLPVRQKKTFETLSIKQQGKQPRQSSPPPASSQVSEDVGFMPAAQPFSPTLPTPERTPSLQSRSSITSPAESEDQASRRLRALANLAPQPLLPTSLSNVLSHWSVGMDPNNYNWEAAQHALGPESQGEDTENDAKIKKRARKSRRQSRYSLDYSSQPAPLRSEEDNLPSSLSIRIKPPVARDAQGSSQTTEKTITVSQIEKGSSSKRSIGLKKTRRKKPGF